MATPALPSSLVSPFRTVAPPSIYVTAAVYDALTRFDPDGNLLPWLATSWRRESPTAWVFTLRRDVAFSNGEPLDATAVAATVRFLLTPEGATEGVARELPFLKGAEAVAPDQVRILTTTPIPMLPRIMTAMPIVAPAHFTRVGLAGYAREPVGTGPFQLVSRKATVLSFAAYAHSWRAPKVAALEFTAVPTPMGRVSGLLSGVFDMALDLGPDDLRTLEDAGQRGVAGITDSVAGLTFFLARPSPFADVRVRQAANMAVNRQAIIDTLLGGATQVSSQPVTPQTLGYDPQLKPFPYDPVRAKALLKEAGYEKGFRFAVETTVGYAPNDAAILQQIAQDLRAVGIEMDIITLPVQEFLTRRGGGDIKAEAFAAEWPAWPTLDGLRAVRTHSCLRIPTWYCNPALTPLIEAAQVEEDELKAVALRREIMRKVRDDAPSLFLFDAPQFTGLRTNVRNYREAANIINYHEMTLD